MNKTNILYIGMHPDILETVVRLLNKNNAWHGTGTGSEEEAMRLFSTKKFNLVLLGCGIESDTEKRLRAFFLESDPSVSVVQHFGGGSGLLLSEIAATGLSMNSGSPD